MFVHIHFQKFNRYGFREAIYNTKIGVSILNRDICGDNKKDVSN